MAVARLLLAEAEVYRSPRSGGTSEKFLRYIIFPASPGGRFPTSPPSVPGLLQSSIAHMTTRSATLLLSLTRAHQTAVVASGSAPA